MRFLSRLAILTAMTLSLAAIGSTRSLAADGYALVVIPPAMGGSPTAFRINIATGQVSNVSGSPPANLTDPQPILASAQTLSITATNSPTGNPTVFVANLQQTAAALAAMKAFAGAM